MWEIMPWLLHGAVLSPTAWNTLAQDVVKGYCIPVGRGNPDQVTCFILPPEDVVLCSCRMLWVGLVQFQFDFGKCAQ